MKSQDIWPQVLEHIDVLCPFAFARMPEGDVTGQQAAEIYAKMCRQTHTHLWLDLEAFSFEGKALIPRPIAGIEQDLSEFPIFEKVICYQYSGIFNAPNTRINPGGPRTVTLYEDYLEYLRGIGRAPQHASN
jgi:hypothetical protein